MKINMKKGVALALVGLMGFGVVSASFVSVSEAASHKQKQEYSDGTTNERSHALHEEEVKHDMNVRALRYQLKKGQITEKEYEKQLKKEQQRHDKVVSKIHGHEKVKDRKSH